MCPEDEVPSFTRNETQHDGTLEECISEQLISDENTLRVMSILMFYVAPAISLFGVVGNIFSLIILVKHGLNKCSNILLFCLAITDLSYLISFNSPPKVIYEVVGTPHAFDYSETMSRLLFVFYIIFNTVDYAMGYSSITLPMLITLERLVAVFLPLMFHQIVTPFRTWLAVACVFVFWSCFIIYTAFWFEFEFEPSRPGLNESVGLIKRSDLYVHDLEHVDAIQESQVYLSMRIPLSVTLIGCTAICIKIKRTSLQRKKLTTTKTTFTSRTTVMLLAVCAVYTLNTGAISLVSFLPEYIFFTLNRDAPSNIAQISYQTMNLLACVNSSSNFVVYVALNKNFRDTYKSLFTCTCYKLDGDTCVRTPPNLSKCHK